MPAGMYCDKNKNELQTRNRDSRRRRKDISQWTAVPGQLL